MAPQPGQQGGHGQTDEHVRPVAAKTAQQQRHAQRDGRHRQRGRLGRGQLAEDMPEHGGGTVLGRRRQTQKIGQGMHRNQQRRARGKAEQHGRRNEIGQHPQPQRANQPLHDAHHHGDGQRQLDIGRTESHGQWRQHGKQRQRIGIGRPRHDMPAGAEQRGDDAGNDGGVKPIFGRQPGQRGKGNALRQHQHRAQQARHRIGAQRGRRQLPHPVAKQALG